MPRSVPLYRQMVSQKIDPDEEEDDRKTYQVRGLRAVGLVASRHHVSSMTTFVAL